MITGSRRRLGLLTTALLGTVALAGCGGSEVEGQASEGSAGSSSSAPAGSSSSSASESAGASASPAPSTGAAGEVEDLSAGLLPAEAFGPGAQATPITADQLGQQQSSLGGLGGLQDVTITPEACAPAVKTMQPGLDSLTALGAQTVTVGNAGTAEILAEGPRITDGIDQLAATVQTCPEATITAPQIGEAKATFTALDVPELGDGSAGVTMTISLNGPDGQPVSVPLLLGMVADGDRLVSLTAADPTGATDPAAFVALLQQAYEHQADVLD